MSKSIYDETLDILLESYNDPQDEDNNCYMINYGEINRIARALEQAQKQEKLLELYKEINNKRKELIQKSRHNTWSWKLDIEIKRYTRQN